MTMNSKTKTVKASENGFVAYYMLGEVRKVVEVRKWWTGGLVVESYTPGGNLKRHGTDLSPERALLWVNYLHKQMVNEGYELDVAYKFVQNEEWMKISRRGRSPAPCCEMAKVERCVCDISYSCSFHGRKCHGTHD